jgi:hypothetical protein
MSIKLSLHIGQHKTGSKALQAFLSHNRANLLRHRIYYPECINNSKHQAYRISHFEFFVLLKYTSLQALGHYNKANAFIQQHRRLQPLPSLEQYLENIFSDASQHGAKQIILSCEDLFDMATAHDIAYDQQLLETAVSIIASICTPLTHQLEVIALLRNPYDLAHAHYAQFIKGSSKHHLNFDRFFNQFHPRLDANHVVNIWRDKLPNAQILLIPYEGDLRKKIQQIFLSNVLKLEHVDVFSLPDMDAEMSNITPSMPYINLIREMNEHREKGLAYIPREIILQYAFNHPLATTSDWLSQKQREFISQHYEKSFDALAKNYLGKEKFFSAASNKNNAMASEQEWQNIKSTLEQAMVYPTRKNWLHKFFSATKKLFSRTH